MTPRLGGGGSWGASSQRSFETLKRLTDRMEGEFEKTLEISMGYSNFLLRSWGRWMIS